ncbi:MAG: tetratricopeptide repeat protein [Thiolinea sp.]
MQEILFLLLPLAFYSGWNAARKRNKQQNKPEENGASTQFVKGINFLLNEEPDKALDIFLESPAIDAQTADTFLSLGNMFRNRGEVNRALRVHQHLVARPDLDNQQRQAAMLALGEDFFAAGMLDRAESVFREIVSKYPGNTKATEPLRHIYEQLQDWDKAIELSEHSAQSQHDKHRFIAHYYCEQATTYLQQNKLYQADESLKNALQVSSESARVKVLQAELALSRNRRDQALVYFCDAIKKDARLLGMLSPRLLEVYSRSEELQQLYQFVKQQYHNNENSRLFPALLDFAYSSGETEDLESLIISHLETGRVNMQTLFRSLKTLQQNNVETSEFMPAFIAALECLNKEDARFQCLQCGYKMQDYLWRCPACQQWDSVSHH